MNGSAPYLRQTLLHEGWVEEVITAHPAEMERYRGGVVKLLEFFVGQVMRRSGGKADAAQVKRMVRERLGS